MNTTQFKQAAISANKAIKENAVKSLRLHPYIADLVDSPSSSLDIDSHLMWILDAEEDENEILSRCRIFLSVFSSQYRADDEDGLPQRREVILKGFYDIALLEYYRSRLNVG